MSDKRELLITPASLIQSRRQKWLWEDRIPLGTVTIFAGRGGEGKSTFALHIAAQAIAGDLEGDSKGTGSNVLIISHEDDWGTVMKPRLIAANAHPDNVFKIAVKSTVDDTTAETIPALPLDIDLLRQAVVETNAKVIIIDPISSTLGGDLHKLADVRRGLDPLAALAQEMELAVVAIMHFNKGTGNVSDKLSGSHAFRDLSRSVLLFATDDETGQRIVSVDKSNYSAERGSSFAFTLTSVTVTTDDGDSTSVARVTDLKPSELSVTDIVNRIHDDDGALDDRSAAQSFILDFLRAQESSEAPARDVLKSGRGAGFSDQELKDARRRCRDPRIVSAKSGFGAGWVWRADYEGGTEGGEGGGSSVPATFATFMPPSIREPGANSSTSGPQESPRHTGNVTPLTMRSLAESSQAVMALADSQHRK